MKLLVVNCSPVRNGATAEIVKTIANRAEKGNEVRAVCVDDYRIALCRGCRSCHVTGECFQKDDTERLMDQFAWADRIVCVSPSYWAGVPGQFKVFIDRCTPWCDTHEPHASIPEGKLGYTVALRTGPNRAECEHIVRTVEHFYGHLHIASGGSLCLCAVEKREDVAGRLDEIRAFCEQAILA